VVFPPSKIQASTVARRVKDFRLSEPQGEFLKSPEDGPAEPLRIFVGVTFFGLRFLVSKKGSWGAGQGPGGSKEGGRFKKNIL
jgi:hypothetical protein